MREREKRKWGLTEREKERNEKNMKKYEKKEKIKERKKTISPAVFSSSCLPPGSDVIKSCVSLPLSPVCGFCPIVDLF